MSKSLSLLVALATVITFAPKSALAADPEALQCSVNVQYSLNNVSRISYVRDFVVSATAPYSEDFGNILRARSFYASVTTDAAGVPTVSIIFDADVDPFNSVDFGAQLRVKSRDGENTAGDNAFFAGNAAHRTRYTLSCARAKP